MKKTLLIATTLLILSACGIQEQTIQPTEKKEDNIKLEGTAELLNEPIKEDLLDISLLKEKIWSNIDGTYFFNFTDVTVDHLEFNFLQAETATAKEHQFSINMTDHTLDSWKGRLTLDSTETGSTFENKEMKIDFINNNYYLTVGNHENIALQESTLTLNEWKEKKKILKELSDTEVIELNRL